MNSNRKYKVITITVSLSEWNPDDLHEINELTTKIVERTSRTINRTIKSHNRFNTYKVDNDGISIKTFPNNI
jgi:hypothetical protein